MTTYETAVAGAAKAIPSILAKVRDVSPRVSLSLEVVDEKHVTSVHISATTRRLDGEVHVMVAVVRAWCSSLALEPGESEVEVFEDGLARLARILEVMA